MFEINMTNTNQSSTELTEHPVEQTNCSDPLDEYQAYSKLLESGSRA